MPKTPHARNHHVKPPVKLDREEKNEKIKELIKLANEKGYLTYDDINERIPESIVSPEEFEGILILLRGMDIEVIEESDEQRFKTQMEKEERERQAARLAEEADIRNSKIDSRVSNNEYRRSKNASTKEERRKIAQLQELENVIATLEADLANLGAHLMSVLYGNTGLELSSGDAQSWCRYKPAMPSLWEGVEAEIQFRQTRGRLTARQGEDLARIETLKEEG